MMKRVFSIGLITASLLPLFAGRVGAQSDNIMLHFRLHGESIPWSVFTTITTITSDGKYTYSPGSWFGGSTPVDCVIDKVEAKLDTITENWNPPFSGVQFMVDSANRMIKGLQVYHHDHLSIGHSTSTTADIFYELDFDPIPFISDSLGIVNVTGSYRAHLSMKVHVYISHSGGGSESGDSTTYGYPYDSLTILETTIPTASVNQSDHPHDQSLRVLMDEAGMSLVTSLGVFPYPRKLEIVDVTGNSVLVMPLDKDTEVVRIKVPNLPPGIYFARLDEQVAKFIVPPR